jgi:hypothetical protein
MCNTHLRRKNHLARFLEMEFEQQWPLGLSSAFSRAGMSFLSPPFVSIAVVTF